MNGSILYAIMDKVAGQFLGQMLLEKAEAAAIRTFGDIAANTQTIVGMHPSDFELHQLGYIQDNTLVPDSKIVITGSAWLAAQQPPEPQLVREG